jgi:hypothetical protein
MFDNSPDKQANAVRQNALAPKEQEQAADRRWLQDALEDDEVREALKSLRAREKAKRGTNKANPS